MINASITPVAGFPGSYKHTPTGIIVHEIRNVDELIAAGGALVAVVDTAAPAVPTGKWAWIAGNEMIELIRRVGQSPAAIATAIWYHQEMFNVLTSLVNNNSTWLGRMVGRSAADEANKVALPAGQVLTLFGITTSVYTGAGRWSHNERVNAGQTRYIGTLDERSFHNGIRAIAGCAGAVTVRVPTGRSYLDHIDAYFVGLYNSTKEKVKPLILPCIAPSKRRAVELLASWVPDLEEEMSIFVPLGLTTGGRAKFIGAHAPWAGYQHPTAAPLKPPLVHPSWGLSTSHATWENQPVTIPPHINHNSNALGFSNAQPAAGVIETVVSGTALFAALPDVASLDEIPMYAILGGLSGLAAPATQNGLTLSSATVFNTAKQAILISAGEAPPRPINAATGLPLTDAEYAIVGQAQIDAMANGLGGDIQPSSWDLNRPGLALLVACCAGACVPSKTQLTEYSAYHKTDGYRYQQMGSANVAAGGSSGALVWPTDHEGDFSKVKG